MQQCQPHDFKIDLCLTVDLKMDIPQQVIDQSVDTFQILAKRL
jgi:hypothetical protein